MNAWGAPERVIMAYCPDQIADLDRHRRSADTTTAKISRSAFHSLSLTGADRFSTSSC
jgi:hypothetical protein